MRNYLLYIALLICFGTVQLSAQTTEIWNVIDNNQLPDSEERYIIPEQYQSFQLNLNPLAKVLATAPMERTLVAEKTQTLLPLPMPDGSIEYFDVVESPIMDPALAEQFPNINTYAAVSVDGSKKYARIDLTPKGFHAIIFVQGESSIYIDPYALGNDIKHYISYYRKDYLANDEQGFLCETSDAELPKIKDHQHKHTNSGNPKAAFGNCELKTYRIAIAASGEYTQFHGGTIADALAAQVTTINRVNAIFERDLAVRLNIIANNNLIIFTNAGTDPYSGNFNAMINQNQTEIDATIGSANYDLGHLFHRQNPGGGLAAVGVICNNANKARAISALNSPVGDPFDVQVVSHELGHQFNARHSFNNSCSGNRTDVTANEVGSGTTIMSYAGVCAPNVQSGPDDYFNGLSLEYMHALLNSGFNSCAAVTPLSNNNPVVSTPEDTAYIPASTPFFLTATASDPDGDILTYCWEGLDTVPSTMPPLANSVDGPLFRSVAPTTNPTRYFPNLSDLSAGGPFTWEVLPAISRSLHFRISVRDNAAGGGCAAFEDMVVVTDATVGPFVETYPNAAGINWTGSTTETVTWNVAGTDAGNVSCANVDILLSTDGGLTYPTVLASNVPNDGSHPITVPNITTTTARIMVRCAGGYFFDISDNNFSISPTSNDYTITVNPTPLGVCIPNDAIYTIDIGSIGGYTDPVSLSVTGVPAGASSVFGQTTVTPAGNTTLTIGNMAAVSPGTYNMTVTAVSTSNTKNVAIQLVVNAAAPAAVTLLSPTNGATNVNNPVNFSWSAAIGTNVSYDIDIATDAGFSAIVENATGLTTNAYSSLSLGPGTQYYWRVTASNSCGTGAISAAFDFTTGLNGCDTISNYDLANHNPALYTVGSGYLAGHNQFGDLAKADYFDYASGPNTHITGTFIGFGFAFASNASNTFDVKVWDGTSGSPGAELVSVPVSYQAVSSLIAGGGNVGYVGFGAVPLPASKQFFVGIEFTYGNDTIALITNTIGQTSPATAWEKQSTNTWVPYDDASSWGVGLAHFIRPVLGTQPIADFSPLTPTVCLGSPITFTNNSSNAATYEWDFENGTPATSTAQDPTVSFTPVGSYTLSLIVTNSCISDTATTTVTVTELTASATGTDVNCNGGNDGTATANQVGGTAPFTYLWDDAATQTTATATGLLAGSYNVTITDANGCSDVASVTINQPATALSQTNSSTDESCATNDGTATATAAGGTAPYAYLWDDPSAQTTASATGLTAGTYNVTITDNNGCSITTPVVVNQGCTCNLGSTTSTTDVSCNGGSDGAATVSATLGTAPFTYNWSNGATTAANNNIPAGVYSVTVTDASACISTETVTITEPSAININSTTTDASCNGNADGAATAVVSGGSAGYTYNWSNGATTANISNLSAGNYSLTVTDANNCTVVNNISINEPLALSTNINTTNISCNGNNDGVATAVVSGGTAGYSYNWSNGATTATNSNLTPGSYTLTITDANTCTNTATVTITEPTVLTSNSSSTDVSCNAGNNGSASISPAGGTAPYSYNWSSGQTTATANNLAAGNYSATVTDANGCISNTSVSINEPTAISSNISNIVNLSCNGDNNGSASLNVSGGTAGYSYNWSNGTSTANISGLSAGSYNVTITDANGCTLTDNLNITEPTAIIPSTSSTNASCNGTADGTASATASGGQGAPYTFNWSNGATTANITGLAAGNYTLTVTDANACAVTSSLTITQPNPISPTISTSSPVSCNGGSNGVLNATTTGGTAPYTYQWSNGATTASVSGLAAGNYTLTSTDANGCSATILAVVTQPAAINISMSSSSESCTGNDGTASATVSNATAPINYNWSNGSTTTNINNLTSGTYSLTVTDANGCSATSSVVVANGCAPCNLVASAVVDNNPFCLGQASGQATASGSAGTAPYSYIWSNGQTTATATGLVAGNYSVTVADASSCVDVAAVTLTNPNPIAAPVSKTDESCAGNDATATVNASGGSAPYSYSWSDGQTTQTATGLSAGSYSITTTDANGCTISANVNILLVCNPCTLTASANTTANVSCNGAADGSISASAANGNAPYSYQWSTGASSTTVNGLAGGVYTITITDANSCTATATTTVTEAPALSTTINASTNVSCNGGSDGSLSVNTSGGQAPYNYQWSTGASTATINNLSAGTYSLTITDNAGCEENFSATITAPLAIAITVNTVDESCTGNDGSAMSNATGGTAPYSINWSTGATSAGINNLSAGSYTLTVTDANGCTQSTAVIIGNSCAPCSMTASVNLDNNPSCNTSMNGQATASTVGGTAPISYAWSNAETTATATNLGDGVYSVTAVDATGCTAAASITITAPTALSLSTTPTNENCTGNNGSATAVASGATSPYSYIWSNGANTATISGLTQSSYTVTATDANGCTASSFSNIGFNNSLVLNASVIQNVSCNAGSNGRAQAVATGALGITYLWSNGATTTTATGLSAGTYSVTATTALCSAVDSVSLNQPAVMSLNLTTAVTNCVDNSGQITTSVSGGGGGPYIYLWTNGSTSPNQSNLANGSYTVTVTSNNGCPTVSSASINIPLAPNLSTSPTNPSCSGGSDGSIDLTATPAGNYSFLWGNGATTEDISGLTSGTYSVVVTDSLGCSANTSQSLQAPTPVSVAFSSTQPSTSSSSDGAVSANGNGGIAPYTYLWNTGSTSDQLLGVGIGLYVVTVTDANGCSRADSVLLTAVTAVHSTNDLFESFEVFPNPNQGDFNVLIELATEQDISLRMTDVLGRLIYEQELTGKSWNIPMNWDRLAGGTYFISLISKEGQQTKKLIIAK
jgi:hypothetical protein